MSLPDDEAIRKIPGTFDGELGSDQCCMGVVKTVCLPVGTLNQLLHNLKTLVDVLIHMENSIVKTVTEKSRVCIQSCCCLS